MSKRRVTGSKRNTGTIKMYGDPKTVAALLGIDETKETRELESNNVQTDEHNITKDECRVDAIAQEEVLSDLESVADSLDNGSNDSDTFDSSDGFDSRPYSPASTTSKPDIKPGIKDVVEPSVMSNNAVKEQENEREEEEGSSGQKEPAMNVLTDVTQQKKVELIDSVVTRDETVTGQKQFVSGLSDFKELRSTLPAINTRKTVCVQHQSVDCQESDVKTKRCVSYKPRTLADYKRWKQAQQDRKLGQLGFDYLNPEYQKRLAKASRQQEYSRSLRNKPSDIQHTKRVITLPAITEQSKREQALEYARKTRQSLTVQVKTKPRYKIHKKTDMKLSLVDVMKVRHAREKRLIDNLRKEVAALR